MKLKAALLEFSKAEQQEGSSTQALRGLRMSLDAYGAGASFDLPLKFAQRILEQSANAKEEPAAKGGAFVQKGTQQKDSQPYYQSYAPRSGQIFGILKQLKEEFETNLANSQKDESKGLEDYAAMKASKEEFIAASEAKLADYQQQHAENKKALFDAKE